VRKLSWIVGTVALLASGAYLLVYVYRWEWHRALLVGIIFNACLVGLCAALVLRRLARVERQVSGSPASQPADPLTRLRAAPVEPPPFRWLRPESLDRTHVFIPILLGGGVLVSGAAWLVERVAGSSARTGIEEQLARELQDIAFPGGPLVPGPAEVLAGAGDGDDPGVRLLLGLAPSGTAR
jgi:H+/Cl- antiporter ClcA